MTLNLFYLLAFLAVLFALLVVFSKNPIHSVLYLVVTFFIIGCHYFFMLDAQFLGVVHVIVYAGAIMVLFLSVIMLLNLNQDSEPHHRTFVKFAAAISTGMLLLVLVGTFRGAELMAQQHGGPTDIGTVKNLGRVLFTEYLLPFEISSVLLLASMVGAVMLSKPEKNQDIS